MAARQEARRDAMRRVSRAHLAASANAHPAASANEHPPQSPPPNIPSVLPLTPFPHPPLPLCVMSSITLDNLELHSVPFEDYIANYFFRDENGQMASAEHQAQIFGLTEDAAKFLWDAESDFKLVCSEKHFKTLTRFNTATSADKEIRKCLYNLGIPFRQMVFWAIQPHLGVVLTWKMVIKYAHRIFWANDQTMWDRTLNWKLEFHHDGEFIFGKDLIFDSQAEFQKNRDLLENSLREMEERKRRGTLDGGNRLDD
jgi:hypothetical protein